VAIRWAVTVAVGVIVLAPAFWPGVEDDFPLSTYPMFTEELGRVVRIDTAVRVQDGEHHRLSPELIGGTDEVILASETVSRALRAGPEAADRLCREIAERIEDGEGGEVALVTETHDAVALLRDDAPPIDVATRTRCPVE
jgi:hypothetical protein